MPVHALLAEVPEPMREPRPTHPPERASGDPQPPPAAGSALGTYLAIAVALLIVVTVVVVVLIDQQLRRGPEVPEVLRPVPDAAARRGDDRQPGAVSGDARTGHPEPRSAP